MQLDIQGQQVQECNHGWEVMRLIGGVCLMVMMSQIDQEEKENGMVLQGENQGIQRCLSSVESLDEIDPTLYCRDRRLLEDVVGLCFC
jgi:hypothetical protein